MAYQQSMAASSGSLLTSTATCSDVDKMHVRARCDYVDLTSKFKHQSPDFSKQYAHVYAFRLLKMRDILMNRVHEKWGHDVPVKRIIEMKEEGIKVCIIIGTLFKHQELKPNILRDIIEEIDLAPQPSRNYFVDEDDILILEDEQQRIRLIGNLDVHSVVTGIVCAIMGKDSGDGKLEVQDYCWPEVSCRVREVCCTQDHRFIVLVSGIGLANNADSLLPLQLLVDWVIGLLGDPEEQENQARTVRMIIAGNSIRDRPSNKVSTILNTLNMDVEDVLLATRHFDDFLHQLANFIEVDLMPGEYDPANHMLPQQPFHLCLFPKAHSYKTMHCVTNPYECDVAGCHILGTSGQPINDIAAFSKLDDPICMLQKTLDWAHLAPTLPDTLSGYPYYGQDPFIITECPDLYFVGNQAEFQTKMLNGPKGQKTRLLCVPSFSKTHTCAIVELNTLDCYPMSFGAENY